MLAFAIVAWLILWLATSLLLRYRLNALRAQGVPLTMKELIAEPAEESLNTAGTYMRVLGIKFESGLPD